LNRLQLVLPPGVCPPKCMFQLKTPGACLSGAGTMPCRAMLVWGVSTKICSESQPRDVFVSSSSSFGLYPLPIPPPLPIPLPLPPLALPRARACALRIRLL
jgi:hypothetical protein